MDLRIQLLFIFFRFVFVFYLLFYFFAKMKKLRTRENNRNEKSNKKTELRRNIPHYLFDTNSCGEPSVRLLSHSSLPLCRESSGIRIRISEACETKRKKNIRTYQYRCDLYSTRTRLAHCWYCLFIVAPT